MNTVRKRRKPPGANKVLVDQALRCQSTPQVKMSIKPPDVNQAPSSSSVKQDPRYEQEKNHSYGEETVTVPYLSLPSSPVTVEQNSAHRQRYTNRPELVANRLTCLWPDFCAAG
jgi:hypothetical protein